LRGEIGEIGVVVRGETVDLGAGEEVVGWWVVVVVCR